MSDATTALFATPLNIQHRALGALMAPFGGWDMPIQYEGIIAEHRWCREQAALFDICHMGEFQFKGDIVAAGLEDLFTFSITAIPVGRSKYGFLLNEQGGIIDDLIVFRMAEDEVMIVVNAATAPNDCKVIQSRLKGGQFTDITAATAKLDLQGPKSREVLVDLLGGWVAEIPYFKFVQQTVLGVPAIVSRTGYTGELGYEIFLPADKVGELWEKLLADERVKPAGLGARDVLRLEVGYSLYGSDIDEATTPLEADLAAFVKLDKQFVGKEALLKQQEQPLKRVKVAFKVTSRRTPRHGFGIFDGEKQIGEVTSGVFSPMLGCGIGLGYVEPGYAPLGTSLTIKQDRAAMEAEVCTVPFFTEGSVRG
ncbi:MAG: glycine cleavage system aminomethyltransferase GcvT [Trichlorobacter sp.]|uniref:glycine cleavage system aminomethyltransferase GcvT n=1 Tax=Trichlorobacter sp. TaxID=2911007 RepID=UPI00256CB8C7|nr:glycine cleavage system aminomethyltransferase GcvT [Trichlorobacter sp.]MDK9717421.1 glycine cleavage system aminomethyltransferase GcvT [Trichlorobacter sp.]